MNYVSSKRRKISGETFLNGTPPRGSQDLNRGDAPIAHDNLNRNGNGNSFFDDEARGREQGPSMDSDNASVEDSKSSSGSGSSNENHIAPKRRRMSLDTKDVHAEETNRDVFFLQTTELLQKEKRNISKDYHQFSETLDQLKRIINSLDEHSPLSIDLARDQMLKTHKVVIPFPDPQPSKDMNYQLSYSKPVSLEILGSHTLQTQTHTQAGLSVDLMVQMPDEIFTQKDYLNFRYFYKRAYYLAYITAGIQKNSNSFISEMNFGRLHDNHLLPITIVKPKSLKTAQYTINIIPTISDNAFLKSKLLPNRNCVRHAAQVQTIEERQIVPTPFYNSSICLDMNMMFLNNALRDTATGCPAFTDACILGRIWLQQRGFQSCATQGGFGHFEWARILSLFLHGGGGRNGNRPLFSPSYNCVQLFRAMLQFFAYKDLSKQPMVLGAQQSKLERTEDGKPMLFDAESGMNILFKMLPSSYAILRREAHTTSNTLSERSLESFDCTFLIKTSELLMRYDLVTKVLLDDNSNVPTNDTSGDVQEEILTAQSLQNFVEKGLGNRAEFVDIKKATPLSLWHVDSSKPEKPCIWILGVQLNMEHASRQVDRGPPVEKREQSKNFREFWGEKAELRRFKDGQILYSVVWRSEDYVSITREIISYLLKKHCKLNRQVEFFNDELDQSLSTFSRSIFKTTVFEQIVKAYRVFENDLRTLDGLPLQIRQIEASDPSLRYCSTSINHNALDASSHPCSVVLQFEGSSRWPDNLQGMQVAKIALLLKIRDLFEQSRSSTTQASFGLENEGHDARNRGYLDIFYPSSGFTFRLRIYQEKEATLLERHLAETSLTARQQEDTAISLAEFRRLSSKTPRHTQSLQSLATKFPALSGTIRLVKFWFHAHLLSPIHITEEAIELLAVYTFTHPSPWEVPSSPMTGFLRTLLLLSRWDWRQQPLIVNVDESGMKKEDYQKIYIRFKAWRKIDPSLNRLALFIATSIDPDGTTWTDRRQPAKVVAARMSSLAASAVHSIQIKGLGLHFSSLFKSPLTDYDFNIRLNLNSSNSRDNGKQKRYKNLEQEFSRRVFNDSTDTLVPDFTTELQHLFGDSAIFFSGTRDDTHVITGLWSPHTAPRKWKVNLPYSDIPQPGLGDQDAVAEINKEGILAEIARLGGDMIEQIQTRK